MSKMAGMSRARFLRLASEAHRSVYKGPGDSEWSYALRGRITDGYDSFNDAVIGAVAHLLEMVEDDEARKAAGAGGSGG